MENCPLEKLLLDNADVDDEECALFAGHIGAGSCSRLRLVSLRHNQIGAMELRNIQQPSFVTGPEAFAESIGSPQCALQILDLGG